MWWAWELFCSVLRIILFLILSLFFTTGLGTSLLHLIIINLSNVSSFNLHQVLSGLDTLPPEQPFSSSWRSNVKQYRPLSDCSWSACALFAQVYICPNIWGKYSVFNFAASVTNTTIYQFKFIVEIQKNVAPGQLYATLVQGVNSVTVRGDSLWKLSMMLYERVTGALWFP